MQPMRPYATGASGLLEAFAAAGTGLLRFCAEALGARLHDLAGSTSPARMIADPPRVSALGSNLAVRSPSRKRPESARGSRHGSNQVDIAFPPIPAGEIQHQAAMLGYINAFHLMALTAAIAMPLGCG